MSQAKLRILEEDYWHEPPFLRRSLLIEINELREQLGMPLVNASLRPLEPTFEPVELEPQIERLEEANKLDKEDRLDILDQIHELLSDLSLSDIGYRMRIGEYTDSQVKYETARIEQELTDEQLLSLLAGLENERREVTESRHFRDNYIYNHQPPGYPTSFIVNDPRYVCHGCGERFPTETPPRSAQTPGSYHGWFQNEVPWIRGGLTMDIDEKGVTRIFHGYPTTGCYAQYARKREANDG